MFMRRCLIALLFVTPVIATSAFAAPLELNNQADPVYLRYALNRAGLNVNGDEPDKYPYIWAAWLQLLPASEQKRIESTTRALPPHKSEELYKAEFDKAIVPVQAALKTGFCYNSGLMWSEQVNSAKNYEFTAAPFGNYRTSKGEAYAGQSEFKTGLDHRFEMPASQLSNELYATLRTLNVGGMVKVCSTVTGKNGQHLVGKIISGSIIRVKDSQSVYNFPPNSGSFF